jgi:O-antigen ligase
MTPAVSIANWPLRTTSSPAHGSLLAGGVWALTLLTISPLDRDEEINDVGALDLIALSKLAIRIIALGGLGYLLLNHWNDKDRRTAVWLFAPLALYWCWSVVSTAWSPLRTVSLGKLLSLLTLCWLSAAVVVVDRGELTSRQLLMHTSAALLVFDLAMQIVAFSAGGVDERFGFYLAHPTTVGGTASLGIVLLLAARLIWKWSWATWLILPGVLIHGSAMMQAHNRTAMIATIVTVAVLLVAYSNRLVLAIVGLVVSVSLLLFAVLDPSWQWLISSVEGGGEFFSREQSWEQLAAFSGRQELWTLIWESFLESPWIGHGYFVTTRAGIIDVWGRSFNANAHNIVLQALASTGVIGAAIFLWGMARPCGFALSRLQGNCEVARRCGLFLLIGFWLAIWGQCDVAMLGPVTPYVIVFFVALGLLGGASLLPTPSRMNEGRAP